MIEITDKPLLEKIWESYPRGGAVTTYFDTEERTIIYDIEADSSEESIPFTMEPFQPVLANGFCVKIGRTGTDLKIANLTPPHGMPEKIQLFLSSPLKNLIPMAAQKMTGLLMEPYSLVFETTTGTIAQTDTPCGKILIEGVPISWWMLRPSFTPIRNPERYKLQSRFYLHSADYQDRMC